MLQQRGLTLVELLVTLTVLAILAAIGIPSFVKSIERSRLVGAADNLIANIRHAQAEATKRNIPIQVAFTGSGTANWTYTIHTNPTRTVNGAEYKGVVLGLHENVVANSPPKPANAILFDPRRNTMLPAPAAGWMALVTLSLDGHALAFQVSAESGYRLCTSSGMSGYPAC